MRVHYGHDYCRLHYRRWRAHGNPLHGEAWALPGRNAKGERVWLRLSPARWERA